jgi:radical SAM protein with 4Fe4S-binding SPASM domain
MSPASSLLPIINEPSENATTEGCGSGCGSNAEDGQTRLLQELRREMDEIVARSYQSQTDLSPALRTRPESLSLDLSLYQPIPLVSEITHREVDGKHAWVGVLEGALAVLEEDEHALFAQLKEGVPPGEVRDRLARQRGISTDAAWESVAALVSKIAAAGMVRGIEGHNDIKIPTPQRFSRFHLTQACQLECIHCYADSSPHIDRSNELTTERWRKLLVDFADHGGEQVLFTGGEALIHRGCIELMRVASDRGIKVTLFTNGIQVPKYIRDIEAYADQVQVSLDGPDAESNDHVRGAGTYKKILRAIDLLLDHGVSTRIGMTVVPSMWSWWKKGFLQFAERYANHPLVEFRLNYGIMQYGRGVEVDSTGTEDPQSVDRFLNRINGRDGARITRVRTGCGYGEQLVVGPDGTVYPCHLLDGPVCHVDDHSVPEIISLLRGLIRQTDVDHVEGCNTCEIRYLCGGSCRVLASRETGSRLITTCTAEEKAKKYERMVRTFAA